MKKKIENIKQFVGEPEKGFEIHDVIREGRSVTIDPLKLSAVLQEIKDKLNEIIDETT